MERPTVAIEEDLSAYQHVLEQAGCHVIPLNKRAVGIAQAIVVQGIDNNFLGMEDPETLAPVINADGMTPDEVLAAVKSRAIVRE